jgi:HD-GYP domain-containing protein (c-di-GMP phosphodiesterase class II)
VLEEKKFHNETKQIFSSDENELSADNVRNKMNVELATCLFRALKTVIIHNIDNVAMVRHIDVAVKTINQNVKAEGSVSLQQSDKKIFVNKRVLMAGTSSYLTLRELASILDQRKVGGFTFNNQITHDEMKKFLSLFISTVDTPELPYFNSLAKKLKEEKLDCLAINRPLGLSGSSQDELSIDRGQLAHFFYAKALIFMKKYIVNYNDESLRVKFTNKCVRTIQELVDLCRNKSQYILGLVSLKYFEEHFYHHSVNVAILSILLGQKIGMDKAQLAELGICALFHDIGLMNKISDSNHVKESSDDHSLFGVGFLIREKNITFAHLRRIVVIFEHHFEYSKANVPPKYDRYELDLFSRIIHIVDTFDILTSDNGVHEPELPDRALAKMMELSGKKFDPALMKTFVNIIGIYPIGTPVLLNTGEIAIVYHSNLNPSRFNKPQIKLVRSSNGASLDGKIVDLDGQTERHIEKAISPKNLGINVTHYLLH